MRLLNTQSLELSQLHITREVPDYAILSHRWNTEEVTFMDLSNASTPQLHDQVRAKNGFAKIQGACDLAREDGYEWIWIDSCCIDKSSSAELQEAINSMWRYYAESNICYAYLADVPDAEAGWGPTFAQSEWFTRGWTLQELMAPVRVEFYAADWAPIGTKLERYQQISQITSIDSDVLVRVQDIDLFSTAERLSWAAHRVVTREEDQAYSLLGLFDVNMPLLYGEGRERAFVRLQEVVYNATADNSIFLFRHSVHNDHQPLLANSPRSFCDKDDCASCTTGGSRNADSSFRYRSIIASERWSTQAHEQLMTTVTNYRNEMSTVLPLLPYRDVGSRLEYFDKDTPQRRATHVAVLNHTLEKYPQGALCLLMHRDHEMDACGRLSVLPAVLPDLGEFVSRLVKTKVLVCPGPLKMEKDANMDVQFYVRSAQLYVDSWDAKGVDSHSLLPAQPGRPKAFKIRVQGTKTSKRIVQVICHISCPQEPSMLLHVRIGRMRVHEIWYIKEVTMPSKRTRNAS